MLKLTACTVTWNSWCCSEKIGINSYKPWIGFLYSVLLQVITIELSYQYFSCLGGTSFCLRVNFYRNKIGYLFRVLFAFILQISLIPLQLFWFWLLLCFSAFNCTIFTAFQFKSADQVTDSYFWIYDVFLCEILLLRFSVIPFPPPFSYKHLESYFWSRLQL